MTPLYSRSKRTISLKWILLIIPFLGAAAMETYAQCDCDFTIAAGAGNITFDGSAEGVQPGDVICLSAGLRERLVFRNINGSATDYVKIINCGGEALIGGSNVNSALIFERSRYFRLTGTGDPAFQYGIKVVKSKPGTQGIIAADRSSDIEFDHLEISNVGFAGFMIKSDPSRDCAYTIYERPNFTMYNINIHDNYVHDVGGEGVYCGNSFYTGITIYCGSMQYPHEVRGVKVYNNIFENCGWESIQVGSGVQDIDIFNNKILNYGAANVNSQNGGIQVGVGTTGRVYNNFIKNGTGIAIFVQGIGANYVFNNVIVNSGTYAILMSLRATPLITDIVPKGFLGGVHVMNNTIINPTAGVIKESVPGALGNVLYNNLIVGGKSAWNEIRTDTDWDIKNNLYIPVLADAKFANPAVDDYHLLPGSPALNTGRDVLPYGVTFDFDNKIRPSGGGFDLGAFEVSGDAKPVVTVGVNQNLNFPNNSTTISGSATISSGAITSYLWTKVSGPSTALLNQSTTTLSLPNLAEGVYVFRMTATSDLGTTGFADVSVTVSGPSVDTPPQATTGIDRIIVLPTHFVKIDGAAGDLDGVITQYQWTKISGPSTSLVNDHTASLIANDLVVGTYVFRLTVTDDDGLTGSDDITVTVQPAGTNLLPIVNGGPDKDVKAPTSISTLHGSASDADGTIVLYQWTQVSGVPATMTDATTPVLSLSGLVEGIYVFRLTATDNQGGVSFDDVNVIVTSSNLSPAGNAGEDKFLTLPTNSTTLSATASDPDGIVVDYVWSKLSGPSATLINANTPVVTVTDLASGVYVFRLIVTDDDGATSGDDVTVNVESVNGFPVANAGPDINLILPVNTTTLIGSASDPDGTISSYLWEKVSGGSVTFGSTDESSAILTDLDEGVYNFRFTVTDNSGNSHSDIATVVVLPVTTNQSPIVSAGSDKTITLPVNATTLTGTASDPDGTIASYLWIKLTGPSVTLSGTNTETLSLTELVQGIYTFRLTATDDKNASSSGEVTVTVTSVNQKPEVNAGTDKNLVLPTSQILLTANATDADGTIVTYDWVQQTGPSSTLTGTNTAILDASDLVAGSYVFVVTVTDNQGATATDNVKVVVQDPSNESPVASVPNNINIFLPTNTTNIEGTGIDTDGTIVDYLWEKISGGAATLVNELTPTVTINDLIESIYVFRLTVTDDDGATGFEDVTVNVLPATANQSPVASAGPNIALTLPVNRTNLIGSASDVDGSIVSYEWIQISGPTATLSNSNTPVLSLQDLLEGIYVFRLVVTDDAGATADSECQVIILPETVNQNPVVNAGNDITLTLPSDSQTILAQASDNDGSISSYLWTKQLGPDATLSGSNTAILSLTDLVEGIYVFRVTVTDNSEGSSQDDVTIHVLPLGSNQPPIANAGLDQTLFLPTDILNLNGNGSDADGNITTYSWTKIQGPPCILANANTTVLSLSALIAGQYRFRLTVVDDDGAESIDEVNVTVFPGTINQSPIANAGSNQTIVLPNSSTTLNGSGFDNDGSIVSYSWTQVLGEAIVLENINSPSLQINDLALGVYRLRLTVEDDDGSTGSDVIEITVVAEGTNQPPLADAGFDQIIFFPATATTIQGTGADSDGSISVYEWTKLSGPDVTMTGNTTDELTLTGMVQGAYKFSFRVEDNNSLSNSDEVSVLVLPASANTNPVVDAGDDVYLRLPSNSYVLQSNASDPNGSITTYTWTKNSGPTVTLGTTNASDLSLSDLLEGTYVFSIHVVDNEGASASDEVSVIVAPPGVNKPPIVSAGPAQILIVPQNSATLNGSAIEEDGFITSLEWKQLSGPTMATLSGATSATLTASDLVLGSYVFELTAIDNENASSSAQTTIDVQSANISPAVFAGNDTTLYLPVNFITLEGIATDSDGFITNYEWSQIEGAAAAINIDQNPIVTFSDMLEGVYIFRLLATDNLGASASDDVIITIQEDPVNPIGASKLFSPNGDDVNEFWTVKNLSMINNCPIRIFNRLGKLVFESENYENNWNGMSNGQPLQDGDYYYVVSCTSSKKYSGAFRLVR